LSLNGRYHISSGEAAGCEPRANALGTTAGCFIDELWSRPSRFNDLALLACIKYTYRTVSHALTYTSLMAIFAGNHPQRWR